MPSNRRSPLPSAADDLLAQFTLLAKRRKHIECPKNEPLTEFDADPSNFSPSNEGKLAALKLQRIRSRRQTNQNHNVVVIHSSQKCSNFREAPIRLIKSHFIPQILLLILSISPLLQTGEAISQSLANEFFTEPNVQPGFFSTITPKGFDLFADFLHSRVQKIMRMGAFSYNLAFPLAPRVQFTLISDKLEHFDAPNFRSRLSISPNSRHVLWTGTNLKIAINSRWSINGSNSQQTMALIGGEPTAMMMDGKAIVIFDEALVELAFTPTVNGDSHLKSEYIGCRVKLGELKLDVADSSRIQTFLPFIHRELRQNVEGVFCPTFQAELVPLVVNRFLNTPMTSAIHDHYFINYGLIGGAEYGKNGELRLRHRGNVFGILRQGNARLNDFRLPFRSAPLTPLETNSPILNQRMIVFQLSNYTFSSLFFWMDQYRRFDYEISENTINDTILASYLKTECGPKEICAGTLFPALAQNFPKGVVSIKTRTSKPPSVRLIQRKGFVLVESQIDAFVTQGNHSKRFLSAKMDAELIFQNASFGNYAFRAQLSIDSFKVGQVVSLVEGIDGGSIEFLVNALNELIISEDIAKKLKDGIRMPILLDFEQTAAEVQFQKDQLLIGVDFCFDGGCKNGNIPVGGGRFGSGGNSSNNDNLTVAQVSAPTNGTTSANSQDMEVNYYDAAGG